mgnify:FL=1
MYKKLITKLKEFNLEKINSLVLIISFILYLLSIYLVNNKYILIINYWFIYYISLKNKNKIIRFFKDITGILLLGFFFISLLNLNVFILDYKYYIFLIVKLSFLITYLLLVIKNIKIKKIKYLKIRKGSKYTFKELRRKKIDDFKDKETKEINSYLERENILVNSEYAKLIKDNLDNLASNELENYIWMNYLRFYKNQKKKKNNNISKYDLVFLIIHVIILLLSLLVR